jgi:hypothetical protein
MKHEKFFAPQFRTEFPDAVGILHQATIRNATDKEKKVVITKTTVFYANQESFENGGQEIGRKDENVTVDMKVADNLRKAIEEIK